MRVLVRAPNWIGDQVMAFPFYRALGELFPEAELSLLGKPAVLGLEPPMPLARKIPFESGFGFARSLRAYRFDLGINLTASVSSAFLLRVAGIPRRVGFGEPLARLFLTRSVPWRGRASGKHKAELYLELLPLLGGKATSLDFPSVTRAPERTIVLAPGASIALREWPYFVELTRELRARHPDFRLVVVGGPSDRGWEKLTAEGAESLIGRTSLGELRDLCAKAAVVIANDSGVAHVAASLGGAPTVVLFGPGDPDYIRPIGKQVLDARAKEVPCSPCESARCRAPFGFQKCLRDLPVEQVLSRVDLALTSRDGYR